MSLKHERFKGFKNSSLNILNNAYFKVNFSKKSTYTVGPTYMYEHMHVRTVGLCSPYLYVEQHIRQLQNE